MRVHHLSCATLCPLGGRFLRRPAGARGLVCHCLLLETERGLVLVDTGLGTGDVADPARLGRPFRYLIRPELGASEPAVDQVRRLGFAPGDVRDVVLTHLDVDHAGGLADFPWARVHVMRAERDAAQRARLRERARYRPHQWAGSRFETYEEEGEGWFGARAQALRGLPPEVLLVPLFGHTRGHAGVAVMGVDGWLLHAGDSYFHRREVESGRGPALLEAFALFDGVDRRARLASRERVRALVAGGEVDVFCAHDPAELARHRAGVR